ncbi:MAG TPA: hypothetical protein VGW38_03870 [Chloroflexota bacterium]|nr:hypothetical protein [Chloroflexota bacterium]
MSTPRRGKGRRAVQSVALPARQSPSTFLSLSQLLTWLPPAGTIEVGLLAVVLFLPLVQLNAAHESFELPKQITLRLLLQATLILVGAVGFLCWIGVERGARLQTLREALRSWCAPAARWQPLAAAGAVLLAWSLSTATSIAPLESFWGAWYRWSGWQTQFYYLVLFVLSAWTLTRRAQMVRVATVAAAAGTVASIYAIIQGTVQRQLIYEITKNYRPYSTFGNSKRPT